MYWLVSLPLIEAQDRIWSLLQNKTVYEAELSQNYRFELPELRVGTLDSLMVLSDDLVKVSCILGSIKGLLDLATRALVYILPV